MNELLLSCISLQEAYQVIALSAGELFSGHYGCLAILHEQDQHLEVMAQWGSEGFTESTFSLGDCWAIRRGQLHQVLDPQSGLVCQHFRQPPQAGYVCLPLTVQGKTLGVLCIVNGPIQADQHYLSLQQLALSTGETIKLALSNLKLREELRQQAIHDSLTGLFNRRYLDETLPRELHLAQRRKAPLSVVMLDIDGFKQFNDAYGHGAGDSLLREFGRALRELLRKSDISCRFGGDEFVLVLPDSAIADTQARMEQIRLFVKRHENRYSQQTAGLVALSVGIAQAPDHGVTESELLRAADKAMYAAKQAGGDRIVIYQLEPAPATTLK